MTLSSFWAERRVLVTGHTGFKGAWLSLWLQQMGARVTGFALAPESDRGICIEAGVEGGMRSIYGDVRDATAIRDAVAESDPEVVFHLAAQPLVRRSYVDPTETFATNVLGTVHLLEALRDRSTLRAVVTATSDKCYRNREWIWAYREDEALGGVDPYSASKACQEHVAASYRSSFFSGADSRSVGLATARAGNVIGGGDRASDRLIPDAVGAFISGSPLEIRNPDAVRPWQFVLEPLAGYLALAERLATDAGAAADAYNFGPSMEEAWPVRRVVDQMAERWGHGASWQPDNGVHPHEALSLRLDATRAGTDLSWWPRLGTVEAIAWTLDWYRAQHEGSDLRAATLGQLIAYENLLEIDRSSDGSQIGPGIG